VLAARRRGKYLWLELDAAPEALVTHLGMSGQLLVQRAEAPVQLHLRAAFSFTDGDPQLRFVDQRTFGGLALEPLLDDGAGAGVPASVAHIARDPPRPALRPRGRRPAATPSGAPA
jgi:formamidopyrimidine-DNA glycosylase